MDSSEFLLIHSTCPDRESAERIAQALVSEQLAACVSRIDGVTSTYRWQDEVETDSECLLLIKTRRVCFDRLRARLLELHPYELPELIAVSVSTGHGPYLNWIRSCSHCDSSPR